MTVSLDFSELNALRPSHIRFGEVVSISLYWGKPPVSFDGSLFSRQSWLVGHSKRKSIHVPPSSNAYWNFVNLRSDLVEWFSEKGTCRRDRRTAVRLLNEAVRWIHRYEMDSCYNLERAPHGSHQYYNVLLCIDDCGWSASVWIASTNVGVPDQCLTVLL